MDYSISVEGRGEAIVYKEGKKEYAFEVFFGSKPYRLYGDKYSRVDLGYLEFKVTENEERILERIKDWLEAKEPASVSIIKEREPGYGKLRTVDELLEERLRRRDSRDANT